VGLGLALGLLGTELCLQLGAAVRAALGRPEAVLSAGSGRTILCVGDSNTYGLHLDVEEAYPAQLQRLLGGSTQVINAGFPGMNSSRVRAGLGRMIDASHPDVVLILVGANDFWTAPAPQPDEGWAWRVLHWSRTYRLLYMVWRTVTGAEVIEVPREVSVPVVDLFEHVEVTAQVGDDVLPLGFQRQQQRGWQPRMAENLAAMVEMARERGAQPIVLTYPSDTVLYRQVNDLLRTDARSFGVPLIDLNQRFRALCTGDECDQWFFTDAHANASGNREVAATIAAWLEQSPAAPGT
jgi:lysophospholipase L1-like esterase